MLVNRVALEIGDALVECEQGPISNKGRVQNYRVCRTAKSFVDRRVGIVAQAVKASSLVPPRRPLDDRRRFGHDPLGRPEVHSHRLKPILRRMEARFA
jgi:hypothetical protein